MSDGFNTLEQLLRLTSARHGVLTSNIANVDTPNYKARDVSFGQILGTEMAMKTTDPKHMNSAETGNAGAIRIEETPAWADGNNVEMDMEVAKMTENAMLYEAGVTVLTKKIQMFKSALRTT